VFFSYERVILAPKCFYVHFVYIDNVLFCVSSISLVTPSSIEYSKKYCACVRDWVDLDIHEQVEHMRTE